MLQSVLICLSIICMAVMFSAIFKRCFAQTVPLAVMLEILIVYLAGLLGLVKIGVYAALAVSVICMLFAVFISIGNGDGRTLFFNVFSVGLVVFLIMAAALFVLSKDISADSSLSDGITLHMVRGFLEGGTFSDVPSAEGIAVAPGYSLFIYMYTALSGKAADANMLTGAGMFAVAMILPVLGNINWKNAYLALAAFPIAAAVLFIGGSTFPVFFSLNADAAVILVFTMMLVTYMCCEQCGYVYWTLGFGSALLCIMRPGAEFLAILMLLIIIADIAALGFFEVGELFAAPSKWISVVFYVLITAFSFSSWWIFCGRNHLGRLFENIHVTPERSLGYSGRLGQVFRAFFSGKAILPYIVWLLIFIALCAGAAFLANGFWNRVRTGIQGLIILIAFAAFMFLLAYAYTYIYPITVNVKETVDTYITAFTMSALILGVNMMVNRVRDKFFA